MEDEKKIKAAEAAKENERKTEEAVKKSTDTPILAPGEKLFTVVLLLTGIIAVILAVQL